jgi:hypothetical protein
LIETNGGFGNSPYQRKNPEKKTGLRESEVPASLFIIIRKQS